MLNYYIILINNRYRIFYIYLSTIKFFFFNFLIVHSWEEEEADRAKAPFPSALPEVSKLHVEIRRGL